MQAQDKRVIIILFLIDVETEALRFPRPLWSRVYCAPGQATQTSAIGLCFQSCSCCPGLGDMGRLGAPASKPPSAQRLLEVLGLIPGLFQTVDAPGLLSPRPGGEGHMEAVVKPLPESPHSYVLPLSPAHPSYLGGFLIPRPVED